jgi:DNA-binding transcriptional LysR family regulator
MTSVTMEWESRLGRRLRVRDLYILSTVVKTGGMAKAARQLAMAQPSVSAAIGNLEHMLGVRLLDRSPRGIEPTIYAEAFSKKYPQVVVHVHDLPPPAIENPGLRDRKFDLVFARRPSPKLGSRIADDLNLEDLFDDPLIIAAGLHSRWARRRKIDLAELIDEPWILQPPNSWNYIHLAEACRTQGLAMPTVRLYGFSMHLANHFVANGSFITAQPKSVARFCSMKELPVKLPVRPWLITLVTLKNRTLGPIVERFIECAREVAKELTKKRF